MKNRRNFKSIFSFFIILFCVLFLSSCNNASCEHEWGKWNVIKNATCIEKGIKEHKCTKCGSNEISVIEELGHHWIEATCTSPRTCDRCSLTEGEKKNHSFTLEEIKSSALKTEATCTDLATYYKSCSCGEISTNENDVFTSGVLKPHVYNQEIANASTLKTEATCTNLAVYYKSCTCGAVSTNENDVFTSGELKPHVYNQEIANTSTLKTEATSTEPAVYYKSCICGAVSTNENEVFTSGDLKPHVYDQEIANTSTLKSEATCTELAVYYKSCICGAISTNENDVFTSGELKSHSYYQEIVNEFTLKSEATCTEYAVYYSSCECGAISTFNHDTFTSGELKPHVYDQEIVNEQTLKTEATCTNLAVYYKSCTCGAISTNENDVFTSGELEPHVFDQEVVNSTTQKSAATCTELAVYYKSCSCGVISSNNNDTFTSGKLIDHHYVNGYCDMCEMQENSCNHDDQHYETIHLKEYGVCGDVILSYLTCECEKNKTFSPYSLDVFCDFGEDNDSNEFTDEDGFTHHVTNLCCKNCGLAIDCELIEKKIGCKSFYSANYSFSINGKVIVENLYISEEHEVHVTDLENIDVSQYTSCGGYISAYVCKECNEMTSVTSFNTGCDIIPGEEERIVDSNGVDHFIIRVTCSKCNFEAISERWSVKMNNCISKEYTHQVIKFGDYVFFEKTSFENKGEHTYQNEYKLLYETCEEGIQVVITCSNCDFIANYITKSHVFKDNDIDTSELGLCEGGRANVGICDACGKEEVTSFFPNCTWIQSEEENSEGYTVYTCLNCGAKKLELISEEEKEENTCELIKKYNYIYMLDDKILHKEEFTEIIDMHEYEKEYSETDDCLEGYTIINTCKKCGYSYEFSGFGHYSEAYVFASEEMENICREHYIYYSNCVCGKNPYLYFVEDTFTYDNELGMYVCNKCHITLINEENISYDGCKKITNIKIEIKNYDNVLVSFEKQFEEMCHSFNFSEMTFGDEFNTIILECESCGEQVEHIINEFTSIDNEYQGYDYLYKSNEEGKYFFHSFSSNFISVTVDIIKRGEVIHLCCDRIDANNRIPLEIEEMTSYGFYFELDSSFRGKLYFAIEKGTEGCCCEEKELIKFVKLLPDSSTCVDGVLVGSLCKKCGYVISLDYYEEHEGFDREIHLDDCECYLSYHTCACEEKIVIDYFAPSVICEPKEYIDENGNLVHEEKAICNLCNAEYIERTYDIEGETKCEHIRHHYVILQKDDVIIFEKEYDEVIYSHSIEISYSLIGTTCDDGVNETLSCKECGYEMTQQFFGHSIMFDETVDLSSYGCTCDGVLTIYSCVCGEEKKIEWSLHCSYTEKDCECTIEEASNIVWNPSFEGDRYYYSIAKIYQCDNNDGCTFKTRVCEYYIKDDDKCEAIRCIAYQIGYNEEEDTFLFEIIMHDTTMEFHDYKITTSEDTTIYECQNCDRKYYETKIYEDEKLVKLEVKEECEEWKNEKSIDYSYDEEGSMYESYSKITKSDQGSTHITIRNNEYIDNQGNKGYEIMSQMIDNFAHYEHIQNEGYIYIDDTEYRSYLYLSQKDFWELTEYEYNVENRTMLEKYSNSYGELSETESDF